MLENIRKRETKALHTTFKAEQLSSSKELALFSYSLFKKKNPGIRNLVFKGSRVGWLGVGWSREGKGYDDLSCTWQDDIIAY